MSGVIQADTCGWPERFDRPNEGLYTTSVTSNQVRGYYSPGVPPFSFRSLKQRGGCFRGCEAAVSIRDGDSLHVIIPVEVTRNVSPPSHLGSDKHVRRSGRNCFSSGRPKWCMSCQEKGRCSFSRPSDTQPAQIHRRRRTQCC